MQIYLATVLFKEESSLECTNKLYTSLQKRDFELFKSISFVFFQKWAKQPDAPITHI